jgi:hypothetical protein
VSFEKDTFEEELEIMFVPESLRYVKGIKERKACQGILWPSQTISGLLPCTASDKNGDDQSRNSANRDETKR